MSTFDAIVLGAGGVGSATLWRLAQRGLKVLGIDRFSPPHGRGSTHGQTRIIRRAYFEHPNYVPLANRAFQLWHELERATSEKLFHQSGLLQVGAPDGEVLTGVARAAEIHGISIQQFSRSQISSRWPALRAPDGFEGLFEPGAGYLLVERCVDACLTAARSLGAETLFETEVKGWTSDDRRITVHTSSGSLDTDRMIITAGPWAGPLLSSLNVKLKILRKSLFWFGTRLQSDFKSLPAYLFEFSDGVFYGFPSIDTRGVKVGNHAGGREFSTPELVDRSVDLQEEAAIRSFVGRALAIEHPQLADHTVCLYTMSPDGHFIVDRLSEDSRIVFAAGLSGHGYKFAPVLGEALADLAFLNGTGLPIEFLSAVRFKQ